MGSVYEIPDKINNFNVYDGKTRLVGVSAEITLPSFDPLTETINVAGAAGEFDSSVTGSFGSMKLEIPFENLYEDFFAFAASKNPVVIRGAMEVFNTQTQEKDSKRIVITVKGLQMNIKPGVLKKGGKGNPSITKEVTYIKITIDGETQVELDKLNSIFNLGGVDMLAKIRSQI